MPGQQLLFLAHAPHMGVGAASENPSMAVIQRGVQAACVSMGCAWSTEETLPILEVSSSWNQAILPLLLITSLTLH